MVRKKMSWNCQTVNKEKQIISKSFPQMSNGRPCPFFHMNVNDLNIDFDILATTESCIKKYSGQILKICWFAVTWICFFKCTWLVEKFFYHFEIEKMALILIYLNLFLSSLLHSTSYIYFFCNVHASIMNLAYFNPHNP